MLYVQKVESAMPGRGGCSGGAPFCLRLIPLKKQTQVAGSVSVATAADELLVPMQSQSPSAYANTGNKEHIVQGLLVKRFTSTRTGKTFYWYTRTCYHGTRV